MSDAGSPSALAALVAHLREEADFNRSWTDGRRGAAPSPAYVARRLELATERDRWADAVRALIEEVEPAAEARLRELLREVLPDTMGGYPDVFGPSGGWDAWEERALAALASAETRPAPRAAEEVEALAREVGKCLACDGEGVFHMPCPCDACGWGEPPCSGPGGYDMTCEECEGEGVHPKAAALLTAARRTR